MSTSIIFIHFGRYCHLIHCQKYACQQVIEIQIFDYGDEQMPKVAPCSKMPVPKSLLSMPYAVCRRPRCPIHTKNILLAEWTTCWDVSLDKLRSATLIMAGNIRYWYTFMAYTQNRVTYGVPGTVNLALTHYAALH